MTRLLVRQHGPMARSLPSTAAIVLALSAAACRGSVVPPPPPPPPAAPAPALAPGAAPDRAIEFTYRPPVGAPAVESISVRGTFNDWAEHAHPLTPRPDGTWRGEADLEPGTHQYKYFINGAWPGDMCRDETWGDPARSHRIHPGDEPCVPDGQNGRNAVITVREAAPAAGAGLRHDAGLATHVSRALEGISIRFAASRGAVRSATVSVDGRTIPMHHQLAHGSRETWRAVVPPRTSRYRLAIETSEGRRALGPFEVPAEPFTGIDWVADAIGYQIFPERFRNGDPSNDGRALETSARRYTHPDHWHAPDAPLLSPGWGGAITPFHCCHQYFGGDLQGIIDRLAYLDSLGVTLLYLNPIFIAGSAHGYDTFDYLTVSPAFGDERLLRTLLDSAHARGMRVMWDFVPNHVGVGHWAFQHAVTHGEHSPYWSWFRFRVPAAEVEVGNGRHYGAWSGHGSLPELETRNPAVLAHLLHVVRHWTAFGFDGIRVDVPNDIDNRAEFFPAFRRAAKSVNPAVYLVGEIWGRSPSWLRGDEFDALMNYAVGRDVVLRFAAGDMSASEAADAMARIYAEYPEASTAMQFNLLASHDTPRLLTSLGGGELGEAPDAASLARHRLASALLHALPGVPVTFQGDECAFLGGGPPREENRYPMQWEACDAGMVAHYARLAEVRRRLTALRSPVIREIRGAGRVLSFRRGEPGPEEVLALFNGSLEEQSFVLPDGAWEDAITGEVVRGVVDARAPGWRFLRRR